MKQEHSADAWRQALICMTGSAWDMEPEWEAEGALLMAYRFGNVNEDEDVIVATVEACASLWQGWSAPAFLGMAHAFMCSFPDLDTVKEQHITENYPGTHADWFKDDALYGAGWSATTRS